MNNDPDGYYNFIELGIGSESSGGKERLRGFDIADSHSQHWDKDCGSISSGESRFIGDIIRKVNPKRLVKVCTAFRLSTGFMVQSILVRTSQVVASHRRNAKTDIIYFHL